MMFFRIMFSVNPVKICNQQITVLLLCSRHHGIHRVFSQPVVTVHKLQILSFRQAHPQIPGIRYTGIFLVNHMKTQILPFIFPADLNTPVMTSVVDQKHFHVREFLFHHAVQTTVQILFSIIYRNNQCNQRHFLSPLQPFYICLRTIWYSSSPRKYGQLYTELLKKRYISSSSRSISHT